MTTAQRGDTVQDLLAELHRHGITVRADGEHLCVRPAARLTAELREQLRRHKPALLAWLQPATNLVSLQPGPTGGLTVPLPALQLLWNLENRGFRLTLEEALRVRVDPAAALTDADRIGLARWQAHLAALVSYEPPEPA